MVKKFGKHFFIDLTEEESNKWWKDSCGIRPDIKTDQQLLDFVNMLKTNEGKRFDTSSCQIYYFPNLNEDEAAICAIGHHSHQDGVSQM